MNSPTRVVAAAIRHDGVIYTLPPPNRHFNIIWHCNNVLKIQGFKAHFDDQGFVDENGGWLSRKAALYVATQANQLLPNEPIRANMLFSENLW